MHNFLTGHLRRWLAVCVALAAFSLGGRAGAAEVWHPPQGASWQWQLSGSVVDTTVPAEVYDIDMFDNDAAIVKGLHSRGKRVICYMSAGSYEHWRPDAGRFPSRVIGHSNGWAGERWLDIRKLSILRPIMEARMKKCAARGYDGIEFDNVDGYANRTGFPLSRSDQRTFNLFLARAAHHRGLAAGLKNDLGQIPALEPHFEFAVNEQCFQYHECRRLKPFVDAGKAVFHVEYKLGRSDFCTRANSLHFSSLKKRLNLGVWRRSCR